MKSSVLFTIIFLLCHKPLDGNPNGIRNHLGTRTPYRFRYNKNITKPNYPGCEAKKIWMLIRHGARLPSTEDIEGMKEILTHIRFKLLMAHQNKKGKLNKEQIYQFSEWYPTVHSNDEKILTKEGQDEMVLLAERMQKRFPSIIKSKYDNETFSFRYTATERAQQSALYFAIGLFGKKGSHDVVFAPALMKDPILRFYKHCERWLNEVKYNPKTYEEQVKFGASQLMNDTLKSITLKLGLSDEITLVEANLMYKICGFETAWKKYHPSPWCNVFDQNNIEVIEYYNDLKHYWMDGFGFDITFRQACLTIVPFLNSFSMESGTKAIFNFAHSGTLLKVLAFLELYKPKTHLLGDSLVKDHQWKTSKIDSFGANIAFVLYDCDEEAMVLTLHQERRVKLKACDTYLCPVEQFKEYFKDLLDNCNHKDMCSTLV